MKRILLFITLILISSCNNKNKTPEIESNHKPKTTFNLAASDYTIIPFNKQLNWIFKEAKPTELSRQELIEIEDILNIVIVDHSDSKGTDYEVTLEGMRRQYVPVINQNGEKEVWINFFCDDPENEDGKKNLITVLDGGNCHFNLKVNLTTKTYSDLYVNGVA